jgi:hypothetical protein
MNTSDSTTQSNVIEAAHRFRPDPLARARVCFEKARDLIQAERLESGDPLARCEQLSSSLRSRLDHLLALVEDDEPRSPRPLAEVIPFRTREQQKERAATAATQTVAVCATGRNPSKC